MSSANTISLEHKRSLPMLFINKEKSNDPKTDRCGTPTLNGTYFDSVFIVSSITH